MPVEAAETFKQNLAQLTPEQRVGASTYVVQKGDSVSSIARKFNTRIEVIRELNDLPSGPLLIGTHLRVPAADVKLPPKVMRAAALVDGRGPRPHVHVVRRGDSLWAISRRTGIDVNTLAMMNGMSPNDTLRAGQRLRLTSASLASADDGRSVTYTVRRGDTLSAIARMFQVTVAQISAWNHISSRSTIRPGQKLTIRVSSRRG